jgi:signal transduction histidine kinase
VNAAWRQWYWDTSENELTRVFDSFQAEHELPPHLLSRMISKRPRFGDALAEGVFPIPAISVFRDAIALDDDEAVDDEASSMALAEAWGSLLERGDDKRPMGKLGEAYGIDPEEYVSVLAGYYGFGQDLLDWLRVVYRPALAVKVLKQGEVAGAYILFGDDQLQSTADAHSHLEQLGATLAEVLVPPSELLEEVTRRESLRRLSTIMHEIGRPAGRAKVALDDVAAFLAERHDLAIQLVPNEEEARNRAQLAEEPLSSYSLSTRVEVARKAVDEIRRIIEQTRQLRRVQGDELPQSVVDLGGLLQERIAQAKEGLPGLRVELELTEGIRVNANLETVAFAVDEVLSNACRELRTRQIASPTICLRSRMHGARGWFEISDNGLAADADLPKNVFDEWVTRYAADSQGSGLALAIVRETFRRHGCICTLEENRDDSGHRVPGVTFAASLPLAGVDQETAEETEGV